MAIGQAWVSYQGTAPASLRAADPSGHITLRARQVLLPDLDRLFKAVPVPDPRLILPRLAPVGRVGLPRPSRDGGSRQIPTHPSLNAPASGARLVP